MKKGAHIRACDLHACLKYVNRDHMTNASLRERFGIEPCNSTIALRIIQETMETGFARVDETPMSKKYAKYVPFWG
jgi:ATP-dependent DNA helicase RecG